MSLTLERASYDQLARMLLEIDKLNTSELEVAFDAIMGRFSYETADLLQWMITRNAIKK